MSDLQQSHCEPCEGGVPSLTEEEIAEYVKHLNSSWDVISNVSIRRTFAFENFAQAMEFVNRVADLAEAEGHHPDITIQYNRVTLELTTHAIKGLSKNDFILAAKVDQY